MKYLLTLLCFSIIFSCVIYIFYRTRLLDNFKNPNTSQAFLNYKSSKNFLNSAEEMPEYDLSKAEAKVLDYFINDDFKIILDSNPTTGYFWKSYYDKAFINLKNQTFVASSGEFEGSSVFNFNALKKGRTALTMVYIKKNEENKQPEDIRIFEINIK